MSTRLASAKEGPYHVRWRPLTSAVGVAKASGPSPAAKAYEDGVAERTVLIEFDSVEKALATHESPAYQAALAALDGGVVRDMRIVPGV